VHFFAHTSQKKEKMKQETYRKAIEIAKEQERVKTAIDCLSSSLERGTGGVIELHSLSAATRKALLMCCKERYKELQLEFEGL